MAPTEMSGAGQAFTKLLTKMAGNLPKANRLPRGEPMQLNSSQPLNGSMPVNGTAGPCPLPLNGTALNVTDPMNYTLQDPGEFPQPPCNETALNTTVPVNGTDGPNGKHPHNPPSMPCNGSASLNGTEPLKVSKLLFDPGHGDDSSTADTNGSNVGSWIWAPILVGIFLLGAIGYRLVRRCLKPDKKTAQKGRVLGNGRGKGRNRGLKPGGYLPQHHRRAEATTFDVIGGGIDHVRKAEQEQREVDEFMEVLRAETAARMEQKKKARQERC